VNNNNNTAQHSKIWTGIGSRYGRWRQTLSIQLPYSL